MRRRRIGTWLTCEDVKLKAAVKKILKLREDLHLYNEYNHASLPVGFPWSEVAILVESRTAKQCRERYMNQLAPGINRASWKLKEDERLEELYRIHGSSWHIYLKHFERRSENSIKMRWRVIQRRKKRARRMSTSTTTSENSSTFERIPSSLSILASKCSLNLPEDLNLDNIWSCTEKLFQSDFELSHETLCLLN